MCPETTECHAEGKAKVVRGELGVKLFDVGWERLACAAINGGLGPSLSVTPWGWARNLELYGRLSAGFPSAEGGKKFAKDHLAIGDRIEWNAGNVARSEAHRRV